MSILVDLQKWYIQASEFTSNMLEKVNKDYKEQIDRSFISKMICEEMEELTRAKDSTEAMDALLDGVYYILQHLSQCKTAIKFIKSPDGPLNVPYYVYPGESDNTIHVSGILCDVQTYLELMYDKFDPSDEYAINMLVCCAKCLLRPFLEIGVDPTPIWDIIHEANMKKFGPGGFMDEFGKWNKPKDFIPPDEKIREHLSNTNITVDLAGIRTKKEILSIIRNLKPNFDHELVYQKLLCQFFVDIFYSKNIDTAIEIATTLLQQTNQ